MTDPRARGVLRHLPLGDPPPSWWTWAVVTPDPVSGLWCRVVDHQPHGDKQLADAERLCA